MTGCQSFDVFPYTKVYLIQAGRVPQCQNETFSLLRVENIYICIYICVYIYIYKLQSIVVKLKIEKLKGRGGKSKPYRIC